MTYFLWVCCVLFIVASVGHFIKFGETQNNISIANGFVNIALGIWAVVLIVAK